MPSKAMVDREELPKQPTWASSFKHFSPWTSATSEKNVSNVSCILDFGVHLKVRSCILIVDNTKKKEISCHNHVWLLTGAQTYTEYQQSRSYYTLQCQVLHWTCCDGIYIVFFDSRLLSQRTQIYWVKRCWVMKLFLPPHHCFYPLMWWQWSRWW